MSAAQQPVHYDILSLRVQRRQQGKAGAGAVCWCAAAALLAGFCECGARAETDPPAAVGAIPSPQLPPFPPRCLSVPCCLRSLPLVRLTFLPPASAAAVRRLGNGVLWGLRLSAPPHRCWCTTCAFNKRRLWWPLLQAAALRRLRKAQGVLVQCGVARGCCAHAAGHADAREGSARHRSEWCCWLRLVSSLSMSCVSCCTVALLAAGAAAALTSTIPAASPPPFFPSCPFSLPHMRASCRGMCVTVRVC
jgi:hypothetical protein